MLTFEAKTVASVFTKMLKLGENFEVPNLAWSVRDLLLTEY